MNQQRTAKCLYTIVLAAHSDTCIDVELSGSDPIRSWTLLGCLLGALLLSVLVLVLICCGCTGSRDLARNFRTHELIHYQALERSGSPMTERKTTSFASHKQAAAVGKNGDRAPIRLLLSSTRDGSNGNLEQNGLVAPPGEESDAHVKDCSVECQRVDYDADSATTTPLLASTSLSGVALITKAGMAKQTGRRSPAKHVRVVLPSDSDEDGPDFV